jgi:hypothetical protein
MVDNNVMKVNIKMVRMIMMVYVYVDDKIGADDNKIRVNIKYDTITKINVMTIEA